MIIYKWEMDLLLYFNVKKKNKIKKGKTSKEHTKDNLILDCDQNCLVFF